jgi:hypothetical protein
LNDEVSKEVATLKNALRAAEDKLVANQRVIDAFNREVCCPHTYHIYILTYIHTYIHTLIVVLPNT